MSGSTTGIEDLATNTSVPDQASSSISVYLRFEGDWWNHPPQNPELNFPYSSGLYTVERTGGNMFMWKINRDAVLEVMRSHDCHYGVVTLTPPSLNGFNSENIAGVQLLINNMGTASESVTETPLMWRDPRNRVSSITVGREYTR